MPVQDIFVPQDSWRRSVVTSIALSFFFLLSCVTVRAASPCEIIDQGQALIIRSSALDGNRRIELSWESCNNRLYEVQTSENSSALSLWVSRALMIGSDRTTTWTDPDEVPFRQRFYRVQRLAFDGDEDGDGVSNLDEFNRGIDLHNPDAPTISLPSNMIVGQTARLGVTNALESCICQWSIVSGRGLFTNTLNCATEFRPSWSGAVTVQVVCASSGVTRTNRARTVVAFPTLSAISDWNESSVAYNNNCYNFATDIRTDTYAQPGRAAGVPAVYPAPDCQADIAGAAADGLQAGVDIDDLCHTSGLPEGHIVALLVWPGYDYHFVRLEADGTWSSKYGYLPATILDNARQPIKDPRTAFFGTFSGVGFRFCGFFWVGPNVRVR